MVYLVSVLSTRCVQLLRVPHQVCYSEHQQELNLLQHFSRG